LAGSLPQPDSSPATAIIRRMDAIRLKWLLCL